MTPDGTTGLSELIRESGTNNSRSSQPAPQSPPESGAAREDKVSYCTPGYSWILARLTAPRARWRVGLPSSYRSHRYTATDKPERTMTANPPRPPQGPTATTTTTTSTSRPLTNPAPVFGGVPA